MTVSNKQLEANRKNAQKGGVKTPEGKALVKYNALKHGLLAKEVVVSVGEGTEDPEEFNALFEDLNIQLSPVGTLEEMLVEKIAVAYWRLRRVYKYEVGIIRQKLDTTTGDFYSETDWKERKMHKTEEEIEQEVEENREGIKFWKKDKRSLSRMHKEGKSLEEIYDWEENWDWLHDKVSGFLEDEDMDEDTLSPEELREFLNKKKEWSDNDIWEALIEICDERIAHHESETATLEKERESNRLKLQVVKRLGNVPSREELERLLRYEGAIERQFYKALNQLERVQRLRSGEKIPAPVEVDLDVNKD